MKLKHSRSKHMSMNSHYITNDANDDDDGDDNEDISYEDITYQTYIDKLNNKFPTYLNSPGTYVYTELFDIQLLDKI